VIQPQRALACRMTVSVSDSKAGTLGEDNAGKGTGLDAWESPAAWTERTHSTSRLVLCRTIQYRTVIARRVSERTLEVVVVGARAFVRPNVGLPGRGALQRWG
jgi:hypothetical protein